MNVGCVGGLSNPETLLNLLSNGCAPVNGHSATTINYELYWIKFLKLFDTFCRRKPSINEILEGRYFNRRKAENVAK